MCISWLNWGAFANQVRIKVQKKVKAAAALLSPFPTWASDFGSPSPWPVIAVASLEVTWQILLVFLCSFSSLSFFHKSFALLPTVSFDPWSKGADERSEAESLNIFAVPRGISSSMLNSGRWHRCTFTNLLMCRHDALDMWYQRKEVESTSAWQVKERSSLQASALA